MSNVYLVMKMSTATSLRPKEPQIVPGVMDTKSGTGAILITTMQGLGSKGLMCRLTVTNAIPQWKMHGA